jgi:acyl carrier protein
MLLDDVKNVIISSVGNELTPDMIDENFPLVGNILDSMAVTNLILALEEYFGFMFEDDDLSAEAFETVGSLAQLVERKLSS